MEKTINKLVHDFLITKDFSGKINEKEPVNKKKTKEKEKSG